MTHECTCPLKFETNYKSLGYYRYHSRLSPAIEHELETVDPSSSESESNEVLTSLVVAFESFILKFRAERSDFSRRRSTTSGEISETISLCVRTICSLVISNFRWALSSRPSNICTNNFPSSSSRAAVSLSARMSSSVARTIGITCWSS